jgi:glutamyl-tRNA synthetase
LPYAAKGEAAFRSIQKGEIIQVERRGFYICDAPYFRPDEPIRMYFIPDGKNMMGFKS